MLFRSIDVFVERDIPFLTKYDTKIIVNVCGRSETDYVEVVERLADQPVDLLEINISCPNVKEGGIAFGQDPKAAAAITRAVKAVAKQPVVMKLSPNVTDIVVMAQAVEAAGADAVSLIRRLLSHDRKFVHNKGLNNLNCELDLHTRLYCRQKYPQSKKCSAHFVRFGRSAPTKTHYRSKPNRFRQDKSCRLQMMFPRCHCMNKMLC